MLLILIIPNLLFGKFYYLEKQVDESHSHKHINELHNCYLYIHQHDHANNLSSHSHSHWHFTKTLSSADSLLFFISNSILNAKLNDNVLATAKVFIINDITQDLFKPPIA